MGYLIFLRHGPKQYKNNHNPPNYPAHDSPLVWGTEKDIKIKLDYIRENFGAPEKIVSSPYKRARDTARYFTGKDDKIYYEKQIGEYLGWQKPIGSKPDVFPETAELISDKLGTETLKQARTRIIEYYKKVDDTQNTLFITHGILISYLYNFLTNTYHDFGNLKGFIITDNREIKMIN